MNEISIKGTNNARISAKELIAAANTYSSCISTLMYTQQQIKDNWEGTSNDIKSINTEINNVIYVYSEKIIPALQKLGNGITAFADAIDIVSSKTVLSSAQLITLAEGVRSYSTTFDKRLFIGNENPIKNPWADSLNNLQKYKDATEKKDNGQAPQNNKTTAQTESKPASTPQGESMHIPTDYETNFKSYTKYTAIRKDKDANGNYVYRQSAILYGDAPDKDGNVYNVYTDADTHVRCVDINGEKYYCAAMGNYYGNVGDTLSITTDKGNQFNIIICDEKSSHDPNAYLINGKSAGHIQNSNNMSIVEFYYDGSVGLPDAMLVRGGSTGTFNSVPQFSGNISSIVKLTDINNTSNAHAYTSNSNKTAVL